MKKKPKKPKKPAKKKTKQSGLALARRAFREKEVARLATALRAVAEEGSMLPASEEIVDWLYWYWDNCGFKDDIPVRVAEAWVRESADTVMRTSGWALLACHWGCTGNLEGIRALLDHAAKLDYSNGADADPILFSASWDAGIFAGDAEVARLGKNEYVRYLAATGEPPEGDSVFLSNAVRSAMLFGWEKDFEWFAPYLKILGDLDYMSEGKEQAEKIRARALVSLRAGNLEPAHTSLRELAEFSNAQRIGPEWVCEASISAARISAQLGRRERAIEDLKLAQEMVDRYGVTAFAGPIKRVYEKL